MFGMRCLMRMQGVNVNVNNCVVSQVCKRWALAATPPVTVNVNNYNKTNNYNKADQ